MSASSVRVVKWTSSLHGRRQTHYGVVLRDRPEEFEVVVEYSHSVPPSNRPAGRHLTIRRALIQEVRS